MEAANKALAAMKGMRRGIVGSGKRERLKDEVMNTFSASKRKSRKVLGTDGFELCHCVSNSRNLEPLSYIVHDSISHLKERELEIVVLIFGLFKKI